jgi:hypothetical protein
MDINQQINHAIKILESHGNLDYPISILKNNKLSQWATFIIGSGYPVYGTVAQSVLSYNVGNTGNN